MVNARWLEDGLHGFAEFTLLGFYSDHAYSVVSLVSERSRPKPPFRFFNMLTKHSSFLDVVKPRWEIEVNGTKQFQLVTKLRRLKGNLKELNSRHYSHISERARRAQEELIAV